MRYLAVYDKNNASVFNEEGYKVSSIFVSGEKILDSIQNAFKTISFFDGRAEFNFIECAEYSRSPYLNPSIFAILWKKCHRITSNTEGVCPFCGYNQLEYDAIELEEGMAYYPWSCPQCKHQGAEYYNMTFAGHNVIDANGEELEIEDYMIEGR